MSFGPDSGPDLACAPAFLARDSGPAQTVVHQPSDHIQAFSGSERRRKGEEGGGRRVRRGPMPSSSCVGTSVRYTEASAPSASRIGFPTRRLDEAGMAASRTPP